jgi:orotate phosphoribosyltransferase
MSTKTDKQAFVSFLIESEVLRFGDFTTKSGRKSPYFINTGNFRTGGQLAALGGYYAGHIRESCGPFDALFGPAYKGIPLAAAAAIGLYERCGIDAPWFCNRKEAKDHGEGGRYIGYAPQKGDRVVFLDDVITAGTALRESLPLLQEAGVIVKDMCIAVDRCERGVESGRRAVEEIKAEYGVEVHSLVTVYDIIEYLKAKGDEEANVQAMEQYLAKQ